MMARSFFFLSYVGMLGTNGKGPYGITWRIVSKGKRRRDEDAYIRSASALGFLMLLVPFVLVVCDRCG